jgi:hypothetical protein
VPWDWRILLNGKGDELMYERHVIVTGGLPFAELKTRSLIDTRARAANDSPDFSTLIRKGLPFALPSDASRQHRRSGHRKILEHVMRNSRFCTRGYASALVSAPLPANT